MLQAGADSYSLSEQGVFSGQSFGFASLVYKGGDSFSETFLDGSSDSFGGTDNESSSAQDLGHSTGTYAAGSGTAFDTATDSSGDNFIATGGDSSSDTVFQTDLVAFYQAGSFANGSYGLSSVAYSASVTDSDSYQGSDSQSDSGTTSASETQSDALNNYAQPGTGSSHGTDTTTDVETTTGLAADTQTDGYSGSDSSSWSLTEQGSYANFSFAFSNWIYQSGDSASESATDSATDSSTDSVVDSGNGNDSSTGSTAVGYSSGGLSGDALDTGNGSFLARGADSSSDSSSDSENQSLYEAGSFAFGSFAFSSVAFSDSGRDTWGDQQSDSASDTATDCLTIAGTFASTGSQAYAGGCFSANDSLAGNATFQGTDAGTDSSTTSDAGNDCWSTTELGVFSSYSFAFASVVYRSSGSDAGSLQDSAGDSFASSSAVHANDTSSDGTGGSASLGSGANSESSTESASESASAGDQNAVSLTDTGASCYSLYEAGSFAGNSFAFASFNDFAASSDSVLDGDSASVSDSFSLSGRGSATDAGGDGGGYGSTTNTGQDAGSDSGSDSLSDSNSDGSRLTVSAQDSFSLSILGSMANGSYAFSSYVFFQGESGSYSAQDTMGDGQRDSGGDGNSNSSSDTSSADFSGVNPGPGNPSGLMCIVNAVTGSDSSTAADSASAADTQTTVQAGTFAQALYQAGVYSNQSFSFTSVVFSESATDSGTVHDAGSATAGDSSSNAVSSDDTDTGANASDSSSDVASDNSSEQGNSTATNSTTDTQQETFILFEAGSYAGNSYSLSSFSLLQQSTETLLLNDSLSDSSSDSGTESATDVVDGYTDYSGDATFSDSRSDSEAVLATMVTGFLLSEQGSLANGSMALSSYAFSQQQSSSECLSETDSSSDSFSGSNESQGYSGSGSGGSTDAELVSASGSLTQLGAYSGGRFALGSVTYQGSGSDSFSDSALQSDAWSGSYGGADCISASDAGSGSYTDSATGCFSSGSFSLSSSVLSGNSSGSYSSGAAEDAWLSGAASTFTTLSSGQQSDTLYQTGGVGDNVSYNLSDRAQQTVVQGDMIPGAESSDTSANTDVTTQLGGSGGNSETQQGTTTYTWAIGLGSPTTATNGVSQSPSSTAPSQVISFAAPDGTVVPVSGADQSGDSSGAPLAAPATSGFVGTSAGWLGTTNQLAWQVVGQGAEQARGVAEAEEQPAGGGPQAVLFAEQKVAATTPANQQGQAAGNGVGGQTAPAGGGSPQPSPGYDWAAEAQKWEGFKPAAPAYPTPPSYNLPQGVSDWVKQYDPAVYRYLKQRGVSFTQKGFWDSDKVTVGAKGPIEIELESRIFNQDQEGALSIIRAIRAQWESQQGRPDQLLPLPGSEDAIKAEWEARKKGYMASGYSEEAAVAWMLLEDFFMPEGMTSTSGGFDHFIAVAGASVVAYKGTEALQGGGSPFSPYTQSFLEKWAKEQAAKNHQHHTIPKEIQKKLPPNLQEDPDIIGRPGLPNRKPVEAGKHIGEVHDKTGISPKETGIYGGKYNLRFHEEIMKRGGYDNVTKEQILEIRDLLVKEFGL